jgi:hypothetical protein
MGKGFVVRGGSVLGRDHALLGRNNQDAFALWSKEEACIAVVTDGCGSGRFSEIGAGVGARMMVEALRLALPRFGDEAPGPILESVRREVLGHLARLADAWGGSREETVAHCLLFTILGAVVHPQASLVFGLGDGAFVVDGVATVVECEDNAPPYLSYGLLGDGPPFALHVERPTRDLNSLVVATDGLSELIRRGSIGSFLEEDGVLRHPEGLTRRLRVLGRGRQSIDWASRQVVRTCGLFRDDATLAIVRRETALSEDW